jgi:multiple sugar transport system ATP-binding protein
MNKIIEVNNLSKKYYDRTQELLAIENISIDINCGEFLAIVGPSGCG